MIRVDPSRLILWVYLLAPAHIVVCFYKLVVTGAVGRDQWSLLATTVVLNTLAVWAFSLLVRVTKPGRPKQSCPREGAPGGKRFLRKT
jgi:predicted permease